jgi:carbamoyltransferase
VKILGYFPGIDPAAAVIVNGEVVAFVEEERLVRYKHAPNLFPTRSIETCLKIAGLAIGDLDCAVFGWDASRYASGDMARFYTEINRRHPPDNATERWQQRNIAMFAPTSLRRTFTDHLVRKFGIEPSQVPPLEFYPHHRTHAAAAFFLSAADEALVLTVDGSGDSDCTTVWSGHGTTLTPLHRVEIPHSLGWFYAAITEYLGFDAYDGEYKVMGLAAYGREHLELRAKLEHVVRPGPLGFDYEVDPKYIHHGAHTYSERFTDALVKLVGLPPRQGPRKLEPIHEDLAFEAQRLLEETVLRLVTHFQRKTGMRTLCIGGGVGLNVKMNSRLHRLDVFDRVYAFPIPGDSGLAIGAPIGYWVDKTGRLPAPLGHLYLGPGFDDAEIEHQLRQCGLTYRRPDDLADATAELLARGKVVGWFQGRMEGGPRALGNRSILADPRTVATRDRVNAAIKFREYWRPFCPSLTVESIERFMIKPAPAPFMILAFDATADAGKAVPAVVHVDDTMRVQTVDAATNPGYHAMLRAFEKRSGVPVVLNTSFNVKGEAIVCTPLDAVRTFYATGIDALAIGPFIVEKAREPLAVRPEDVLH